MALPEFGDYVTVTISVASGGYIVHANVPAMSDLDDWVWVQAVFTDLETMLAYVRRVTLQQEGPCDQSAVPLDGGDKRFQPR